MTEVIAALIVPILIMFFLIMATERIFWMFIRSARFIERLNGES